MHTQPKDFKDWYSNQGEALLSVLKHRFDEHMFRHQGHSWPTIQKRLEDQPEKLWSLQQMEDTGGEPDMVGLDSETGEILFFDCSPESPKGRRSVCYDREGLESRKSYPPENSAQDMAQAMGVSLLTEAQYRYLQQFGPLDAKTSSWLDTQQSVRKLGGALFGDYRYGRVFIYHNGAQSYYSARGFRAALLV
ncbi:DUF4256 domain-containing protein [Cyclobacterium jeungdonense]|uniref:DUF4256 domain-containing protein n=1 Tax=Cyclobacterium jeungdonense TaxID=708087 RepID=A0ABT8CA11_9BACT|nr:DUF4256 domain-containing protein [Cyclobacterium jeungdonense]MDN3689336.1 DUF4256 domain-containing protein [Cyclobacterium jeungdonense]